MANTLTGDKALLQQAADSTYKNLTALDGNLNQLSVAQATLQGAMVSEHTGTSVYNALENAVSHGKKLAGTLQSIIDSLHQAGINVDAQEMENKGKLDALGGLTPDVGGAMGKINLSAMG